MSLKAQLEDTINEATTLREQLSTSEDVKARALDQAKLLESQKTRLVEESEDRAKIRYHELEHELDEKTHNFEETIAELQ